MVQHTLHKRHVPGVLVEQHRRDKMTNEVHVELRADLVLHQRCDALGQVRRHDPATRAARKKEPAPRPGAKPRQVHGDMAFEALSKLPGQRRGNVAPGLRFSCGDVQQIGLSVRAARQMMLRGERCEVFQAQRFGEQQRQRQRRFMQACRLDWRAVGQQAVGRLERS